MQNKCFNCAYFMSCKKADPNIKDCLYFNESNRTYNNLDKEKNNGYN